MYYIIADHTGLLLGESEAEPDIQKAANQFGCALYAIEGEHSGLSASPIPPQPPTIEMDHNHAFTEDDYWRWSQKSFSSITGAFTKDTWKATVFFTRAGLVFTSSHHYDLYEIQRFLHYVWGELPTLWEKVKPHKITVHVMSYLDPDDANCLDQEIKTTRVLPIKYICCEAHNEA